MPGFTALPVYTFCFNKYFYFWNTPFFNYYRFGIFVPMQNKWFIFFIYFWKYRSRIFSMSEETIYPTDVYINLAFPQPHLKKKKKWFTNIIIKKRIWKPPNRHRWPMTFRPELCTAFTVAFYLPHISQCFPSDSILIVLYLSGGRYTLRIDGHKLHLQVMQ